MMYIFTYLFYLFHNIIDYFYIGYCEDTEDEIIQLTQEPVITYDELINNHSTILSNKIEEDSSWELL